MPIVDSPRAKEFVHLLRERISEQTVSHCVFTAALMASFAGEAGITNDQAVTAGLLHDLCKDLDDKTALATAETLGIRPTEVQRLHPPLLHGPLAAAECRRNLDIRDEAVLDAICWHTTGKPGFGPVGLALYFADFAEPSRRHPASTEAREILRKQGFKKALLHVSHHKLEHVKSKPHVDPVTLEFHRWLGEFLANNE